MPTPDTDRKAARDRVAHGVRAAQVGVLANAALAVVKLLAGLIGNSYALVADAIESSTDVLGSIVVWGGLRITERPADDDYPYGYGRAETLAAGVVAFLLLGAAASITIAAVREILTPHHTPAPFTLAVLALVVVIKEVLFRWVLRVGHDLDSTAVRGDAWHHRSDALTSLAAFVGIALALLGGPGWESADDWAALVAAAIIAANGLRLFRPVVADLMDRAPEGNLRDDIHRVAADVPGVRATEKLKVRKHGLAFLAELHVQADPDLTLHEAHVLGGRVRGAIRSALPDVADVLIHMEPYEPDTAATAAPSSPRVPSSG